MGSRRILISSTRKPVSYINLAKRFLQEHGEVQLSALGIAVRPCCKRRADIAHSGQWAVSGMHWSQTKAMAAQ